VVEQGSHAQLLQQNGEYAKLHAFQNGDAKQVEAQ
jgi:ABC-type multidrug transport system fused ATPase/permease subunit